MKKTICLLLALIMALALFAAPAAAEEETVPAEPVVASDAPVEPTVTETVPDTTTASTEPSAEPSAEPSEEPAETPAEPTETPAEPETEAAADPAAVPMTTALDPVSEPVDEVPERRVLTVDPNGGVFPGERWNYPTITTTLSVEKKLGDLTYCEPIRTGYRFVGWYSVQYADYAAAQTAGAQPIKAGDVVDDNVETLYACWVRTVVLDAEPGNFLGEFEDNNYTKTVDLVNSNQLPSGLEAPVYDIDHKEQTTVQFIGWFTEKCVMTQTPDEGNDQDSWTWNIETQGHQITESMEVPEGVTTLYAGYKLQEGADTKVITYYYDWNGINGMYGHCLTATRHYDADAGGVKMSVDNAAIAGLNWDGQTEFASWADMEAHWATFENNGYKFLGWATEPNAAEPNIDESYVIKNGVSLYAVWTKGDKSNQTFDRSPAEAGPLEFMRFNDGNHLNYSTHAGPDKSVTLNLACFPLGCEVVDLTWTVRYTDGTLKGTFKPYEAKVTAGQEITTSEGYFKLSANGQSLTITDLDGMEHGFTVTATAKSNEGTEITVAADAKGSFNHSADKWETSKEPKCTEYGEEQAHCTDCGMLLTRKLYPLQHVYNFNNEYAIKGSEPTCTKSGTAYMCCYRCGEHYQDANGNEKTQTVPATGHSYNANGYCDACGGPCVLGDVNADGTPNIADVQSLFLRLGRGEGIPVTPVGDVNKDGGVTVADVQSLFLKLGTGEIG